MRRGTEVGVRTRKKSLIIKIKRIPRKGIRREANTISTFVREAPAAKQSDSVGAPADTEEGTEISSARLAEDTNIKKERRGRKTTVWVDRNGERV